MSSRKALATITATVVSGAFMLTGAPQSEAAVGSAKAVVAIGDSYPSGAMGNEHNSYVERYGRKTGQKARNWSYSGWRTDEVLYQMNHSALEMRNLRDARTVIVTVGANDISENYDPTMASSTLTPYNAPLRHMRRNLHTILGKISKARGGKNSRVVVTTYNNIYADGSALNRAPRSYRYGADRLTNHVNLVIMAECRAYKMACVDVTKAFNVSYVNSLVTADGTHPSSRGHQVYANLIYAKVH